MVGLVIVSHSYRLAEGVKELAEQMSHGDVQIAAAGGIGPATIGTDFDRISAAITEVYSPDGVLILMDLGSAVLTTMLVVNSLSEVEQANIRLSQAPLIEGTIAAAVEAVNGGSLADVEKSACASVRNPKVDSDPNEPHDQPDRGEQPQKGDPGVEIQCTIRNKLGLHARAAALVVQESRKFKSLIQITNCTQKSRPANAQSIMSLMGISALQGHQVSIKAEGADAIEGVLAVARLFVSGFDELETDSSREPGDTAM